VSRGLPGPVREYLDAFDPMIESLNEDDREALIGQVFSVLNLYQGLTRTGLARLIMESVVAMDGALVRAKNGGDLEHEIREIMRNSAALCAALTRKERGRPRL
jgi:hypothetical protein